MAGQAEYEQQAQQLLTEMEEEDAQEEQEKANKPSQPAPQKPRAVAGPQSRPAASAGGNTRLSKKSMKAQSMAHKNLKNKQAFVSGEPYARKSKP